MPYFTASTHPAETNKKFAESLGLDYPILSDPEGKTATDYGIYNAQRKAAQRHTFYIGKDGNILAIHTTVKTETHGNDVAKMLGEVSRFFYERFDVPRSKLDLRVAIDRDPVSLL